MTSEVKSKNTNNEVTDADQQQRISDATAPDTIDECLYQSSSHTLPPRSEQNSSNSKAKKKNDARRKGTSHKRSSTEPDQSEKESLSLNPQVKVNSPNEPGNTINLQQSPPIEQHTEAIDGNSRTPSNTGSNRRRQSGINREKGRELKELKEQLKSQALQIQDLNDRLKLQASRTREVEAALLSATRTCNQLDKLLHQELASRSRLEAENESLTQSISRLKAQISSHEKDKFNSDELLRVLNATLMERETEVSILKLKLTRLQTNSSVGSSSNLSSSKQNPCQVYASTGRSNSEFNRNSYIRSSLIAEASARASTSQLRSIDRDASVWATVPEELTPSKRPQMLERSYQYMYADGRQLEANKSSTPLSRDRRYKTLPRSMKSSSHDFTEIKNDSKHEVTDVSTDNQTHPSVNGSKCQITNLDDSSSPNRSNSTKVTNALNSDLGLDQRSRDSLKISLQKTGDESIVGGSVEKLMVVSTNATTAVDSSHYSTIGKSSLGSKNNISSGAYGCPPSMPHKAPTTPIRFSDGLKRMFGKFRRSDSTTNSNSRTDMDKITPKTSPFKRGANRSTLVGSPQEFRAYATPMSQAMNFQTDKPFDEWDTDMLVDWMTTIGLSMYTAHCRRWVKCGAHIMNATPAEVDRGLGITNHLHRKKLRLAISELNGDCDKVTKSAARLDYLWVARWLDDIGLPQYKESFINARVDGRVLNYLTVEDLVSLGVKSLLHHASIRCGIRVLRSINFDLQQLKRRATAEEIEQMSSMRQRMDQVMKETNNCLLKQSLNANTDSETEVPLWTCHRLMEWLRLIDFAEFAPNLRGSGAHGGLLIYEDGFNIDTMCSLLSIPISRTLLRRHLSTFFNDLIGKNLAQRKREYSLNSNHQLNPLSEIKTPKKSPLWFSKLKSSRVSQDGMDEYLCPMYPVETQILKTKSRTSDSTDTAQLSRIPESINV